MCVGEVGVRGGLWWEGWGYGGGRIQTHEDWGSSISPLPLLPHAPLSSSFCLNNEGWCIDGESKVSAVANGPWTTLQSHVPVDSLLSQVTKHRVPLVLEHNHCVVHSGAACYTPTCCVPTPISLCCHSSKSTAVCDLSFVTASLMRIHHNTPVQTGKPKTNACKLAALFFQTAICFSVAMSVTTAA